MRPSSSGCARRTEFDRLVGHARRYDVSALRALLTAHELTVEKSAAFGMRPTNPRLLRQGMRWLMQHRTTAMRCYNWVLLPLGLKFQKRLSFVPGWIEAAEADGRRPRAAGFRPCTGHRILRNWQTVFRRPIVRSCFSAPSSPASPH